MKKIIIITILAFAFLQVQAQLYTSKTEAPIVLFNTTTNLGADSTFASSPVDVRDYKQVQTNILASHDGTINIAFVSDAGGTDTVRSLSIPYTAANGYQLFSAPRFSDYIIYSYTNGSTLQTDFYYETLAFTQALSAQVLGAKAFISPAMTTSLGRNILVGEDNNNTFRNVPADVEGNLNVHIASPVTAFSDLRTAELTPQAHLTFEYNINPKIVNIDTADGGTVTQDSAMALIQTSTDAAGQGTLSSIRLLKYRSGLGALARFTGLFTTGVANSTQGVGIGSKENGYFFGYNGTAFGILHRIDSVDTWIPQTTWNFDKMDGTGRSGMTIDPTKINVFEITYQYLGAGQIVFYIEDDETGDFTPVHKIDYANNFTTPSLFNPALPLSAFAINDGNTSNLKVKTASMAAFVEGKNVITGPSYTFTNSNSHTGELALFSVRSKTTFAGKENLINAFMKELSCANDVNALTTFNIYEDATIGGSPSFTDVNTDGSIMETDIAGTTVTNGTLVASFTVGKDSGASFDLTKLNIIMKVGSTYTVSSNTGGASNAMGAALSWVEDF